jgi:hypothetical protein
MTRLEGRIDDFADVSRDRNIVLALTLLVTTLMVAVTVYVMSSAFLRDGASGFGHRATIANCTHCERAGRSRAVFISQSANPASRSAKQAEASPELLAVRVAEERDADDRN